MTDKLNLVGEFHTESDQRRDAERQFCRSKIQSSNYWVEHEFPDVYDAGQLANFPDAGEADLMEYRGAHGVAMAIKKFEVLGEEAVTVSTTSVNSAAQAVRDFNGKVRTVLEFTANVKNRSRLSSTNEVNTAVQAVYDEVVNACRQYANAIRNAPPAEQLVAVRALANSRVDVRDRLPALVTAVGARLDDNRDAAALAQCMRKQRSAFMGVGAVNSGLIGVWKVGNGHVTDLKDGTAKVDLRRINIVTRDEFESEFQTWRSRSST
ncbi:hypothetical protein [Actinomadura algeriensis]|uniref:Uncharacterized protein n=1 Tax=Actinomadura algeriensis TaxID=1679523 RepID=A0ABR9JUN1_9ACTN|nr:hypothetical protein [Actinomadura algeriensis]MBE1534274.1 hypothetical protein [Actinomadura algeriensis]